MPALGSIPSGVFPQVVLADAVVANAHTTRSEKRSYHTDQHAADDRDAARRSENVPHELGSDRNAMADVIE